MCNIPLEYPLQPSSLQPHRCPVCEGTGQVWSTFYEYGSVTTAISKVTCRSCGGSGIVWG